MFGKKQQFKSSTAAMAGDTPDADQSPFNEPAESGASTDQSSQHLPAVIGDQQDAANQAIVSSESEHNVRAQMADNHDVLQYVETKLTTDQYKQAKRDLLNKISNQIDFVALQSLKEAEQRKRVVTVIDKLIDASSELLLNAKQIDMLREELLDEIFGFGPIEPLLEDPDVADIMINTCKQVYVEKGGKVYATDVTFDSEEHLLAMVQRVAIRVGRRIDEASPMVDARMPDGSRFNAIIPPLAIDGILVSIRKFKKNKMPLSQYVEYGSMSEPMYKFLEICSNIGLNIMISGGTGSGKTTLLNALSGGINFDERIITIEDAAELQLQQPHVLRLETRPASSEGKGEIGQRQLVKNALRMRPDRIILGEIRGEEVIDVLAAMNTGHDGSMATIHANTPRDCLARIENLVSTSGVEIPMASLRKQISSAIQIIVQIERMRDGKRRITAIEEVAGMEGDMITMQTIFSFKTRGMDANGNLLGDYVCHGIRPMMITRAEYYNKQNEVLECIQRPA